MLSEVYEEECLSHGRVSEWYKRFCGGRENVEDDDRLGCPVTWSSLTSSLPLQNSLCHSKTRARVMFVSSPYTSLNIRSFT